MSVLLAGAALSGCAPFGCSWVVPEAAGVEVTAPRKVTEGECNCLRCSAPGRFQLKRDAYTIVFSNGDRWYTYLLARARGAQGETLEIRSQELGRLTGPPSDLEEFDYFMRIDDADDNSKPEPPIPVTITIVDGTGRVLGVESIMVRIERRRDYNFTLEM